MAQFAGYVRTIEQAIERKSRPKTVSGRAKLRLLQREAMRKLRVRNEAKRNELIARLRMRAEQADDPANWISLAGLSDDELKADLFRP